MSTGVAGVGASMATPRSLNMARTLPKTFPTTKLSPVFRVPFCTSTVATGPRPRSSLASSTVPCARRSGTAFRSCRSATRQIISISRLRLVFCFAETSTKTVLPPQSSGIRPRSASCFFTRMRARGSKVTDIVVLVVAADDGVMPQTLEAIDHAKAANVPIIVAVNKIDKPDALPERVKKQLADRGLMPEDWGGSTVFVDVSAKQKTNLNLLMEMICLVADLQDLKAVPDRLAQGTVLEAKLDRGRGPVATVLVQNGTLRTGDNFVVGNVFGRVRAMFNDRGAALDAATPATPVEILGLESLPQAGDQLVAVADREKARGISEYREGKAREAQLAKSSRVSLEGLAEQLKSAGQKELDIILKGDVQGSVEVLGDVLTKLSNDRVKIKILLSGVGAITETDVLLASASNAVIIGFNVRPERKAQELAEQEKVDIRLHSIIYELADEIKRAMTGLLEPIIKETYLGRADVRDTFRVPKIGTIAGCYVTDGVIKRDAEVRLLRDNVVVFKGKIGSVRRFKEDVSEVRHGMECGISIANYGDIKVGDVIEDFVIERVAAEAFV